MDDLTLTPEEQEALQVVTDRFREGDENQARHRTKWDRFYSKYRAYQDFKQNWKDAPDRDVVLREGRDEWGPGLFIPFCFSTVETIVPRLLSNRPRMLVLPRDHVSEANVKNMEGLIDAQQEQIDFELRLQDTVKAGLIFGLGVQKTFWKTESRIEKKLGKRLILPGYKVVEEQKVCFDDPVVEDVDPYDFFWDPYGDSIETCEWVIHRTWRSHRYVMENIASGNWRQLEEDTVKRLGSREKYDETRQSRETAEGIGSHPAPGEVHEVLEFHNRKEVVTVLDRQVPVQIGDQPYWHYELPFQVYRPTRVPKHMVGISEVEALEDLQDEMNTLRTQRRDNAALKLQQVFAYHDGIVDPADLKFFAGAAIGTRGEPRDLLMPINVGDIPNSGYQEENALVQDIERTSGISDAVSGAGTGAAETATGVQLVQAAANVRIQLKTRRAEVELITPATRQFVALNQQKILTNRDVRIAAPPTPDQPDRRWAWLQVSPEALAGDFSIQSEGGTAPENVPQERQDAQMLWTMFAQDPAVKHHRLALLCLEKMGVKLAEGYMEPELPQVDPMVLQLFQQHLVEQVGVPPEVVQAALQQAEQLVQQQRMVEQGSPVQAQMNGGPPQQQERPEPAAA